LSHGRDDSTNFEREVSLKNLVTLNLSMLAITPMCKVKIAEVVQNLDRIQASLLVLVPHSGGTAPYLANMKS
jgi:hypothetical protein